jgi:hypothetical protein
LRVGVKPDSRYYARMDQDSFVPPPYLRAPNDLLDRDLRRRVERLLAGERRVEDLSRLFLDLRAKVQPTSSVREIGDFVAHRDKRDRGVVMTAAQDLYTSAHSWLASMRTGARSSFTLERFAQAARANLRRATPDQLLKGCGLRPAAARTSLERAIKRIKQGGHVSKKESRTFEFLATAFIWNQAFDDHELFDEFASALVASQLLLSSETTSFASAKVFVTLFAVSQMHLGSIALSHGSVGLYADFDNSRGNLWVRAQISIEDQGKPIYMPLCVFLTSLPGASHCDERLTADPASWHHPVEVVNGLQLAAI